MGFWKKALGVGLAAAGVMTANPMLVGAGASIVAGDIAAEGAKDAAEKQQEAADKAIATQRQAAAKSEAAFAPYQQTGQNALGTLGQFMGFPSASNALGTSGGMAGMSVGALPANAQTDIGVRPDLSTPGTSQAIAKDGSANTPQAKAAMQTQSGYQPTGQSVGMFAGGSLVQMRAPTGEVQWVPRDRAPFLAQRGAVEVN